MKRMRHFLSILVAFTLLFQTMALVLLPSTRVLAAPATPRNLPPRAQWVEDESRRTANAKHFRAGDFMVAEIHATPVHYKDQQGKWQPIETAVTRGQDGDYTVDAGHYKARLNAKDQQAAVSVDLGLGRSVRMAPDDLLSPPDDKNPPGHAKFDASADGHKIRFHDQSGVIDYEYEAGDLGLKETITLRKYTGKADFFLPVTVDGLDIRSDENGGYSLIDRTTHDVRAVLTPPVVVDAAGQGTPAIRQSLTDNGRGPGLMISIDRDWLEAKDRQYPVVIDPSVIIAPDGADLMAATITAPGSGQVNTLNLNGPAYYNEQRTLLKFDLSSVPQGAMVSTALLDVARPISASSSISVYEIKSEWYPPAVTWISPRGQGTTWTAGGDTGTTNYGNLTSGPVTLTALVQSWVNRTRDNNGILLRKDQTDWYGTSLSNPTLQVIYALDIIPPTASLGGITNGAAETAPFPVTVTAADLAPGGIGRIDLLVDDTVTDAAKAPTQAATSFTVDPRRFGPGVHMIKANVYDFAGNEVATAPLTYQANIPEEPSSLIATPSDTAITLNWDPPVGAQNVTYNIYRMQTTTPTPAAADRIATGVSGTAYSDLISGPRAEAYYYAVSAVSSGVEGRVTTTRLDMPFAPGRPQIMAVGTNATYNVNWAPSPRAGITYNVYRGDKSGFTPSAANRAATGVTGTSYVDGVNYLPNGSFETATAYDFSNWYYLSSWPYSAAKDNTTAKFGTNSLKMWQNCTYCYNTNVYNTSALVTGPITVSGWSKASGVTGTPDSGYSIYVVFYDQWWNWSTSTYLNFSTGTHDWEQVKYTFPNPNNQPYRVQVWVYFQGNHTGTAWFDGIQVEPGSAASDYREYVAPDTSPFYVITAVDGSGSTAFESKPSPESNPKTQGATFVGGGTPTFQTPGDGQVQVSWQPSPDPGTTYNVYRATYPYNPPGAAYMVAGGLTDTTFLDGLNHISNSGFESSDYYGNPYSWSSSSCSDFCPQTDVGAVTGARSLRLGRTNTAYGAAQASQGYYMYQATASPVTISAYSRSENMTDGTAGDYALQATFYDSSWTIMGTSVAAFTSGTHGWERKTATFTPPRPIYYVALNLVVGTSRTGKAWFDNVQLEDGTAARGWQEGMYANGGWYYLVRAVSAAGVETQNLNWQYVSNRGGVLSPTDLTARNLGGNIAELNWTPLGGVRYAVERATVDATGYVSSYRQVSTGLTGGTYRSSRNLIPNSSFEDDANWDYIPDGWTPAGYTSWTYSAYQGSRSPYIYRNYTTDPTAQYWRDVTLNQSTANPLTLSGMVLPNCVYGTADQDFGLRLELRDAAGNLVGSGTAQGPMGCPGWQKVAVTVTPSAPAKTARVIAIMGGGHTGSAYVDAVQLEAGAQATAYTDDTLAEGTTYSYRVTPIDYWGNYGAPTPAVTVKVTGNPMAVTGQTAQSGADGRISLAWTPSITPNATYSVYRMMGDRGPKANEKIASGLTGTVFTDSGNLVANAGFDQDQNNDNLPDGWSWISDGRGAQLVTAGARVGRASLQVTRAAAADPDQGVTTTVSLRQSQAYPVTISAFGKTVGMTGGATGDVSISVKLFDVNGQQVGAATLPFAGGADWTRPSATITPTAAADSAVIQVLVKGGALGSALFDGVQLQPGTAVTDWTEGPVISGRSYYYRVAANTPDGRETVVSDSATAISRSWTLAAPTGDAPGAGLDDRWAFADLAVPGGTGYLNVNNGNLVVSATDSVVPGPRLAQVFRRTYNSINVGSTGLLGSDGWTLNVNTRLTEDTTAATVTLTEGDGSSVRFSKNADGTYAAPPSVWMTLTPVTVTYAWQIARRDGIVYSFDAQGRIRRYAEPNGNALLYEYDEKGRVSAVTGPSTLRSTLGYDGSDRVHTITDAAGRTLTYDYDLTTGRLNRVTDPQSLTVTYAYGSDGRLASIQDAAGRKLLFTYDAQGRFASYAWANVSGTTRIAYADKPGLRETVITDGLGNASTLVTNAVGNLVETRDAKGNATQYQYDRWQRITQVVSPRGLATEIQYETGAVTPRVTQVIRHAEADVITTYGDYSKYDKPGFVVDPTGIKSAMTYDVAGNVLTVATAAGTDQAATMTYTYAPGGMPLTVADALGNTTTYETDSLGRVTAVTNAAGGKTSMTYDKAGNLIQSVDPNRNVTTYAYDALGRRTQTVNPDGGIATWRYDGSGLLVEAVAPGNIRTTYRYDDAGRMTAAMDAMENATRAVYDDAGRQILTFYPNGSLARKEYDELGRVVRAYSGEYLTDAGTPVAGAPYIAYSYDAAGNLVQTKLPNGYTATAEYDLLNRPVKVTQPPATTSYTYDKAGRQLTVQDGLGRWTRYEYDAAGRLAKVYDAANLTGSGDPKSGAQFTGYGYDQLGRRISVTDPLGSATRYEYNALGLVTRETDPLGQMTMAMYDPAGRTLAAIDRNGNVTSYEYDAMNRTTAIHYDDDYVGVHFEYDAGGRRISMRDRTGSTYYTYDQLGRLTAEEAPSGAIRYEYDAVGLRTALALAEGTIRYEYDRSNRLKRVTDIKGAVSSFRYGAAGEVLQIDLPGGVTEANTYDPATNRLTALKYTHTTGRSLSYSYTYDTVGNITSVQTTDGWDNYRTVSTTYQYDELNRLQYVYNAGNGQTYTGYTYDGHGNRVREETGTFYVSGTAYNRTMSGYTDNMYSPAHWLIRSTDRDSNGNVRSVTEYAYDGNGNLTAALGPNRTERYTYNAAGQMIRSQVNNQFTYNTYDGDGRRVSRRVVDIGNSPWWPYNTKESTSSSSHYQYDGVYVIAERDGAGALRNAYSRAGGRLLTWFKPQLNGETSGEFLVDHLGSVAKMPGASNGYALNQYDYDAFGKVTALQENVPNDLKFTGALLDSSGLYHLSARFYNPTVGRFITQDTYKGNPWQPWTQNLYVYTGNNPVNYVDPTGHCIGAADLMCQDAGLGGGGGSDVIGWLLMIFTASGGAAKGFYYQWANPYDQAGDKVEWWNGMGRAVLSGEITALATASDPAVAAVGAGIGVINAKVMDELPKDFNPDSKADWYKVIDAATGPNTAIGVPGFSGITFDGPLASSVLDSLDFTSTSWKSMNTAQKSLTVVSGLLTASALTPKVEPQKPGTSGQGGGAKVNPGHAAVMAN